MKNVDYYVLTNKYVMTKVERREWEMFKFEDYLPNDFPVQYPLGQIEVFDDPDIFIPAIKSIVNETKRSFFRKRMKTNCLVVFVVDELNSTLRKRLFIDGFVKAGYKRVYLTNIGPSAISSKNRENYKNASIVVSVIGTVIELSLCIGGGSIINHVVKEEFWSEFIEFEKRCYEIRKRPLSECINLEHASNNEKQILESVWDSRSSHHYVLVLNYSKYDVPIDSRFIPDYTVNFTDVAELVDSELREILNIFKRRKRKNRK